LAAPVIEVSELTRTYRSGGLFSRSRKEVQAVRGISFAVRRGELFGLLGPNGAGKTTTIKMLMTLLLPTSGSARVLGLDVVKDAQAVRRKVGYVFGGDRGLYERLSGLDNLRYFAELYGVPPKNQKARIGELLELVGLNGREKERVEGYSRGMRQRLHIARGLLHGRECGRHRRPARHRGRAGPALQRARAGDPFLAGEREQAKVHIGHQLIAI